MLRFAQQRWIDRSIDHERKKVHGQGCSASSCQAVPYTGKLRTDLLVAALNTIYNFYYMIIYIKDTVGIEYVYIKKNLLGKEHIDMRCAL